MKKKLWLMMGLPGSGKSTFLKKYVNTSDGNSAIISRDKIRFSLINPNGDYFSREKEVLEIFYNNINTALKTCDNVYADQVSLTKKSRKNFLSNVHGYDYVYLIFVDTDLDTCLQRNAKREGLAHVPEDRIIKMSHQLVIPSFQYENFDGIFHYDSKTDILTCKGVKY